MSKKYQKQEESKSEQKEQPKAGNNSVAKGMQSLQLAKKIKEEMKDFYSSEYKSSIDLQNMIKNRGFSYLNSNCQQSQTIVQLSDAQEIVDIYLQSLKDILPAKQYNQCQRIFARWNKISLHKFVKMQILFSVKGSSSACFVGCYMKRSQKKLYIAYKVVKNAFRLAPDIYIVHESCSERVLWGAFSESSVIDNLAELPRGFNKQDLAALMEIASMSLLNLSTIDQMQKD